MKEVERSNHAQHVVEFAIANLKAVILYLQMRSSLGIRPWVWWVVGKMVIACARHRLIRWLGKCCVNPILAGPSLALFP